MVLRELHAHLVDVIVLRKLGHLCHWQRRLVGNDCERVDVRVVEHWRKRRARVERHVKFPPVPRDERGAVLLEGEERSVPEDGVCVPAGESCAAVVVLAV